MSKNKIEQNNKFNIKSTNIRSRKLINAIIDDDLDIIRELVPQVNDIDQVCIVDTYRFISSKTTLLGLAVELQNIEAVQLLIDNNANVNASYGYDKNTPLICAIYNNNFEISQLLLENKADANITDNFGKSAVTYAASNDLKILELVLDYNGNVNTLIDDKYLTFETPLTDAITSKNDKSLSIVQKLLKYGADIEYKNYRSLTPLQVAIKNKCFEVIKELLSQGAKVDYDVFEKINIQRTALKILDIKEINKLKILDIKEINKLLIDARLADVFLKNPSEDLSALIVNDIELFVERIINNITKQDIDYKFKEYRLLFNENESIPDEIKLIFNEKLEEIGVVSYVKSSMSHVSNGNEKTVAQDADNIVLEKKREELPIQDKPQNDETYIQSQELEILTFNLQFTDDERQLAGVEAVTYKLHSII